MLLRLLAVCVASTTLPARAAELTVPLWTEPVTKHTQPESAEDKHETGRLDRWISYVSEPTITLYPAPNTTAPAPAVLVIPGGGFRSVCIDKEGIEPAHWLNSLGFTAAVLKYRTLDPATERTPKTVEPIFADGLRAMRLLRQNAPHWQINPNKIGVMGFSAGGPIALRLTMPEPSPDPEATLAPISYRPDFVIIAYGGIPPTLGPALKPLPPFFIVHAADDPKAPVAITSKIAAYARDGGASVELHIFLHGDHGFGIQPPSGPIRAWPDLCANWLRTVTN